MGNPFGRNVILPLTNQSGGSVAAGDVVYLDTGHDDSFVTGTTGSYTGCIGIAQQAIGSGSVGLVLVSGYAALVNVNASVTRGHYGSTYTVAKQATDVGASRAAGTCMWFMHGGTTPDAVVWPPDLGGSSMTNPMTTEGDLITSSSGSTPDRIGAVATGKFLGSQGTSTEPAWLYPPGHEYDYVEFTASVTITATTEGTANTIVTGDAVTYDGSTAVIIEFFSVAMRQTTAGDDLYVILYDGSSSLGYWGDTAGGTTNLQSPALLRRKLTPSAGAHTYSVRAFVAASNGVVVAGVGGAGHYVPGYIRQTQA